MTAINYSQILQNAKHYIHLHVCNVNKKRWDRTFPNKLINIPTKICGYICMHLQDNIMLTERLPKYKQAKKGSRDVSRHSCS